MKHLSVQLGSFDFQFISDLESDRQRIRGGSHNHLFDTAPPDIVCYGGISAVKDHCDSALNFVEIEQRFILPCQRVDHISHCTDFIQGIDTIKSLRDTRQRYRYDLFFFHTGLQKSGGCLIDILEQFLVTDFPSEIIEGNIRRIILVVLPQVFVDRVLRQWSVDGLQGIVFQPRLVNRRIAG